MVTVYEPNLDYDGATMVELDGVPTPISELPDANLRAESGYGHFPYDVERRRVVEVAGRAWPYTPTTCLVDRYGGRGEWLDESTLFCPGCGLDFT